MMPMPASDRPTQRAQNDALAHDEEAAGGGEERRGRLDEQHVRHRGLAQRHDEGDHRHRDADRDAEARPADPGSAGAVNDRNAAHP